MSSTLAGQLAFVGVIFGYLKEIAHLVGIAVFLKIRLGKSHKEKDEAVAKLAPLLDYSEGGFSGQLTLNLDSRKGASSPGGL